MPNDPTFAGFTAAEVTGLRNEALARLRFYKTITCTAEKWDRMCALLDLCLPHLDHSACLADEPVACPACELSAQIGEMLKGARGPGMGD